MHLQLPGFALQCPDNEYVQDKHLGPQLLGSASCHGHAMSASTCANNNLVAWYIWALPSHACMSVEGYMSTEGC